MVTVKPTLLKCFDRAGEDFMSKISRAGGGNKRVTSSDGRESRTYNSWGRCIDITHHEKNGKSHSHNVGHGLFGPFAGSRKK